MGGGVEDDESEQIYGGAEGICFDCLASESAVKMGHVAN